MALPVLAILVSPVLAVVSGAFQIVPTISLIFLEIVPALLPALVALVPRLAAFVDALVPILVAVLRAFAPVRTILGPLCRTAVAAAKTAAVTTEPWNIS
jgi:hypothetical protein